MNKQKISSCLLALLLASGTPIHARIDNITDTFTYTNSDYIYVNTSGAEYMITSDNGLIGRGNAVYGITHTGTYNTQNEWEPLTIDGVDVFDNVIGIYEGPDGLVYIRTDEGLLYRMGGSYFLPQKKVEVPANNEDKFTYSTTAPGKPGTYVGPNVTFDVSASSLAISGTTVTAYKLSGGFSTSTRIIKADAIHWGDGYGSGFLGDTLGGVVLLEDGTLLSSYIIGEGNKNLVLNTHKTLLDNVSEYAVPTLQSPTIAVLRNNKLFYINSFNGQKTAVQFMKDNHNASKNIVAFDILNSTDRSGTLYISTNLGIFTSSNLSTTFQYNDELTKIRPIYVHDNKALGQDGKIYSNINDQWVSEDFQEWQYNNPIVPSTILANISIENGKIFDRATTIALTFSLVSTTEPQAFNLYYSKADEISDPINWRLIEQNIAAEKLNPILYETGQHLADGTPITGKTYTYSWDILENTDLTHIQLIVEPVY